MSHLTYLLVLLGICRRLRLARGRASASASGGVRSGCLLTLLPVVGVFYLWDAYAVSRKHWTFDPHRVTGLRLPGDVPLEELLFFVVVPVAAILTLEAVRRVRGWPLGDGDSA